MNRLSVFCVAWGLIVSASLAIADDAELKRFQGHWQVIELVEDGKVIPPSAIEDWLPSGGKIEIVDNAIVTTSTDDGKKQVRILDVDATQYPKGIEIKSRDKSEVMGIYRFDNDRLLVCVADSEDATRPREFSAKAGSKRMLMTLKPVGRKITADERKPSKTDKPEAKEPADHPEPSTAGSAKLLSDDEATRLLSGTTWKYNDAHGALVLALNADGGFSTTRESTEMRLFKKVFVRAPVSNGSWSVQKGKLWFHIKSSTDPDRVNVKVPFTLRVITDKDLIFVDYVGHVGQAVRVK